MPLERYKDDAQIRLRVLGFHAPGRPRRRHDRVQRQQDVLGDIQPETVTLILTDPPYPIEYLPLWSDLGQFGGKRDGR